MTKEEQIKLIAGRIRDEHRKHPDLDWAEIAASKLQSQWSEFYGSVKSEGDKTSEVKRYTFACTEEFLVHRSQGANGDYVTYADYQKLKSERDKLRDAIQKALSIKQIWLPYPDSAAPEHEGEAIALQSMHNEFIEALNP